MWGLKWAGGEHRLENSGCSGISSLTLVTSTGPASNRPAAVFGYYAAYEQRQPPAAAFSKKGKINLRMWRGDYSVQSPHFCVVEGSPDQVLSFGIDTAAAIVAYLEPEKPSHFRDSNRQYQTTALRLGGTKKDCLGLNKSLQNSSLNKNLVGIGLNWRSL